MGNAPAEHGYTNDVFMYYGDISRYGYSQVSTILEAQAPKTENACLILVTRGGDPDAGYRIARAFHHHYRCLEILIPDICKSAGTLVCIGAHKLIVGDRGELGPLDIQLSKPDEMFENMSGLDIIQSLNALEDQVLSSFRKYLLDIRTGSHIRTSLAADIAAKLADGFVAPIASKIDPITLGEHQRAMQIAYSYGQRLNDKTRSLKNDSLVRMVSHYPSHGFVIDRKEAAELFERVEAPSQETVPIYQWARELLTKYPYPNQPVIIHPTLQNSQPFEADQNEEQCTPTADEPGSEEFEQPPAGERQQAHPGNEPPTEQQTSAKAGRRNRS